MAEPRYRRVRGGARDTNREQTIDQAELGGLSIRACIQRVEWHREGGGAWTCAHLHMEEEEEEEEKEGRADGLLSDRSTLNAGVQRSSCTLHLQPAA